MITPPSPGPAAPEPKKPPSTRVRNFLAFRAIGLSAVSYAAADAMHWWGAPTDYWFMWASIATGAVAVACLVGTIVAHCDGV